MARTFPAVLMAAWIVMPSGYVAAAPAADVPDSVFARADRFLRRGAPDSVLALVIPLVERAAADGDGRLELLGRLHQAGGLALSGRLREAEPVARRAGELAARLDAPGAGRMSRRWLGYALLGQGRAAEAGEVYAKLRDESLAAGDGREEAYARMGLAYLALGRGEAPAARADYERAVDLFAVAGEVGIRFDAMVGLARALGAEGRYQDMRHLYERILREGETAGVQRAVGYALNNLGSYEYQAGDPGLAVDYWNRALEHKRGGDPSGTITPAVNLALARMSLGAFDEARATLLELRERCREGGYLEQEAQVIEQLATFEQAHGRQAAARGLWRQVLAMGDAAAQDAMEAVVEIVASLAGDGQATAALALADSAAAAWPDQANAYLRARLDLTRAQSLATLDRHREAIATASRARVAFHAGNFRLDELSVLIQLAASERSLAERAPARADSARVRLEEARRLWEDVRAVPRDPLWRERRGALATTIHLELADLLLEHPATLPAAVRDRAAFDALQGYKARTLLERRLGPDAFVPGGANAEPPVTLERLQREVLQPGELLLDYYLGEHGSLAFAVTDTSCRAVRLPSAPALRGLVGLFLDLVSAPVQADGAARADFEPAARRLGKQLLAPFATECGQCRRVLIAADGYLNRLPFELLPSAATDGPPLGADREVVRVPSASMLAQIRAGHDARVAAATLVHGLRVLAGDAGAALPGADRETRDLRRHYRDVKVVDVDCEVAGGGWATAARGGAALHIPAHSEAFDQRPWNSRIRIGTGGLGQPCWLQSADIAALPLAIDLAVLSGCSSAGGQTLSGEGVLGLSSAFLAAGSRAVVASLWDVDDGATALLMRRFYRELAAGHTVAGALAIARRDLANRAATAAPCYWAGFVVVGDGALTVPLRRRAAAVPVLVYGGLAVALGALGAGLRGRRRGNLRLPVIFRRGGPLP